MPEEHERPHTPPEFQTKRETVQLKEGLNAVLMPDIQDRDTDLSLKPVSPEETVRRLQNFLDEIEKQGGNVLTVITVPVKQPVYLPQYNATNYLVGEPKQIFIIRK